MIDLSKTIEPKSDQLNADDLIAGPKTITITKVSLNDSDQPVSIHYEGDDGKPYKPCKSMRRLMIIAWGSDGNEYIDKQMTLYLEPSVKWAGSEVGGIRISHMSGIENKLRVMLTEAKGRKSPVEVLPLQTKPKNKLTDAEFNALCKEMDECGDMATLSNVAAKIKDGNFDAGGTKKLKAAYKEAQDRVRELI